MNLSASLSTVLRTTKDHLEALKGMGIKTVEDLLLYLPRTHEDLSQIHTLATAPLDTKTTIKGTVSNIKLVRTRQKKQFVQANFTDAEGDMAQIIWFNQPHIMRMLSDGDEIAVTGKLVENGSKLQILSPQFERGQSERPLIHAGKLVAVYPQHDIINTKWIREKVALVKESIKDIHETLPEEIIAEENLMRRKDAIHALHFPEKPEDVARAKERMAFEELYNLQLQALERKRAWQRTSQARLKTPMDVELIRAFFASLKFTPTDSQRIAIYEILRDMEQDVPMSRLLEGDVGSGKTLVAVAVIANTLSHGGQCALMVPTEVLARQHAESITRLLVNFHKFLGEGSAPVLKNFPLASVALLTGSVPRSEADVIKLRLAAGTTNVIIGTHALIEDNVRFKDLRLVIVDEQHRFGVMQRERLKEKGSPHFLSMTATPIPRTLALTAYGDHDLSVLLEKPGKRQKIETRIVPPSGRETVEHFIDTEIQNGRQIFVICPLIKESEELEDVRNVEREVERLKQEFPRRNVTMLHGQMTAEEKQIVMQAFRDRKFDILVSTSVIEVGIDVPNATIIVIEGAERFGLAQLHQLRGRVGRGDHKSYCFLFSTTQQPSLRLKAMEKYDSGFQLAEIDLKLRGPGEIFGLRQSGLSDDTLASLFQPELVVRARRAAEKTLSA